MANGCHHQCCQQINRHARNGAIADEIPYRCINGRGRKLPSSENQMSEEMYSVTGDTEDSGWLPLPRPDFGSQPLTDRRREAFARALFEGIDVQAAYQLAGFKRPRSNAQRMEREPLI